MEYYINIALIGSVIILDIGFFIGSILAIYEKIKDKKKCSH